ncbi:MAG: Ig-like domain-containing protein, partial [Myxococcales bacterium]|nr:Ig-like domain-containing protein [Myxococcales bacterium]
NLVVMYDGYLAMPWAPEFGLSGGLTFFEVKDPCAPTVVGHASPGIMRETHALGFSPVGGRWAVTMAMPRFREGGLLFWDVSDPTAPAVVNAMALPGFRYPDAYARIVFAAFWQAPYVYAAGADNGVYVVDATNPTAPELVNQYVFEPVLRAGQIQAIGDLLIVTSAEQARTALLDISDPANPQPIPGGDFVSTDGEGTPREAYFSTASGGHIYYARKDDGGGLMVWDIRDPTRPVYAGGHRSDGNGGYVFVKGGRAFTGESRFAAVYDVSDLSAITEISRLALPGDLDTATPIGNVVVLSVDDKAEDSDGDGVAEGTVVVPFDTEPDAQPPQVTWVYPADGGILTPTSRVGVGFDEMVDVKSAWEGSVRLYRADAVTPAEGRVDGWVSAQEHLVNFWPRRPLTPGTAYVLELPAGGVTDYNGNALAEPFTARFTVAGVAP